MVTSRIWFTSEQKAELWERWKQSQSISSISRALERGNKGGVQRIVSLHGGIALPVRRRAASALELGEREEISRGIAAGRAIRAIARGKSGTISINDKLRDLAQWRCTIVSRNPGRQAGLATSASTEAVPACSGWLRWRVAQKLALQWSPEQIAG